MFSNRKSSLFSKLFFSVFIFFLAPLLFTGCSEDYDRLYFQEGWQYSLNGKTDFKPLPQECLSNLERLVPDGTGFIYLRYDFRVPASLTGQDLGFYLGRITIADETFLNGTLIGKTGRFPPHEFSAWNTARYYHCDPGILTNISNELLIKIYVNGEGAVVSTPFLGTAPDAQMKHGVESFWNAKIHLLCAFFMLLISIYHLILFFKRRQDKENFLFALINIVLSFYLSVFYISELPTLSNRNFSFLWFQKIVSNGMTFLFPPMITGFVNVFLKRKERKWILHLRMTLAVIPILIILFIPDYPMLHSVKNYLQFFLVPPMLYLAGLLVTKVIKKDPEAKSLLIAFSPLVVIFIVDLVLHNYFNLYNLPYISTYGWMCVVLTLLFMLAGRFADSRTEVEILNESLEQKVQDRTKELSESNERLEFADRMAKKDMQLAVYVQKSFYPKRAPDVDGWDIAYAFKPSAGVSGDLYDFYTEGRTLKGISLFDVSGHGIASGLVTMLAKTIISQQFESGQNEKLSEVMTQVSEHVAAAKGEIENYLTGIILRVKGDYVTYVNGAHPSMLYHGASGSVHVVAAPGKQPQGPVVGIAGLGSDYESLSFRMKKGDALVLFTDCLTESKNESGEMFGEENIMEALKKATGKSAGEKIMALQAALKEFTGEKPLSDDLTIIVLQKK